MELLREALAPNCQNDCDSHCLLLIFNRILLLKQQTGSNSSNRLQQHHDVYEQLAGAHIRSNAEAVFCTLRTIFPEDARVLNLDLAAFCDWPDFRASRWNDWEVAVPFCGVSGVDGTSFMYHEDFSCFFSQEFFQGFRVYNSWVLPAYDSTPSYNMLMSQIASATKIPSVTVSTRDRCSLLVVVSGIMNAPVALDIGVACEMLPKFSPALPVSLLLKLFDLYQQQFAPIPCSQNSSESIQLKSVSPQSCNVGSNLNDEANMMLLLCGLKRFFCSVIPSARSPIFKRVVQLASSCSSALPVRVFRSGLLDMMLKTPLHSHRDVLLDAIRAVSSEVCVLPPTPNDPCDIIERGSPNNWPDIINTSIADLYNAGCRTFHGIIVHFLSGKNAFFESFGSVHVGIIDALHSAVSRHFRAHYSSSKLYDACILRNLQMKVDSNSNENMRPYCFGDFSSEELVCLLRAFIHLLLSGKFLYSYIESCNAIRSCLKPQESSVELQLLTFAYQSILNTILPTFDRSNSRLLHVCFLPRFMYELALNFTGLDLIQLSADRMVVGNVIPSLGWCEFTPDAAQRLHRPLRVSLKSGAMLDALRSLPDRCASVTDLASSTRLPYHSVLSCMRALSDLGFVRKKACTTGSQGACTEVSSSSDVFEYVEAGCVAATEQLHSEFQHDFPSPDSQPSPLSLDNVDSYMQICCFILKRVVDNYNASTELPFTESLLIADVSSSESVPAFHVAAAIYNLIARDILKRFSTGNSEFVVLAHDKKAEDFDFFCKIFAEQNLSDAQRTPIFNFRDSCPFRSIVAFAVSDVQFPQIQQHYGMDSVSSRCFLSMNPSNLIEIGQRSSAEQLLMHTINQLCQCSGAPFPIVAKELISAHGYPERVIIKHLDNALYASMFCDDAASSPVAALASSSVSGDTCPLCLESEHLIHFPCKHCVCEGCFSIRFLSDRSQNIFGALPEEETPSALPNEDGPQPADYFVCPFCRHPLGRQFWLDFPDRVEQLQQQLPDDMQISVDDVNHKIVLNTLRALRCDPLASIARCDCASELTTVPSRNSARYFIALNTALPVTILGKTFDRISDLKKNEGFLGKLDLDSQWGALLQLISAEGHGVSSRLEEDDSACSDLKPHFVSDAERPQNEAERLMDFRMCPVCFFGNYVNTACSSMSTHHGERNSVNGSDFTFCIFVLAHRLFIQLARNAAFTPHNGATGPEATLGSRISGAQRCDHLPKVHLD
jgi:hypothetical protein